MKIYVATKFDRRDEVREIYKKLREHGHEITRDWTVHDPAARYGQYPEKAKQYAEEDVRGVQDCDVLIILSDQGGSIGMHIETGLALERNSKTGKPEIYVIGEHTNRSIFYFLPHIKQRSTLEEVIEELSTN